MRDVLLLQVRVFSIHKHIFEINAIFAIVKSRAIQRFISDAYRFLQMPAVSSQRGGRYPPHQLTHREEELEWKNL
jgi:hypothetical protein